jgi:hypothetical protein
MNSDVGVVDQNPVSAPASSSSVPVPQMGSLKKEAPIISIPELKPAGSEVSHNISQELKDIGVEEKKDGPDLTFEHKKLGFEHAGPSVPIPPSPSGKITLPMSEEEIASKLKVGQDDDSGKWHAGLLRKIIAAMRFKIH